MKVIKSLYFVNEVPTGSPNLFISFYKFIILLQPQVDEEQMGEIISLVDSIQEDYLPPIPLRYKNLPPEPIAEKIGRYYCLSNKFLFIFCSIRNKIKNNVVINNLH